MIRVIRVPFVFSKTGHYVYIVVIIHVIMAVFWIGT
jgi:hypothetical protein